MRASASSVGAGYSAYGRTYVLGVSVSILEVKKPWLIYALITTGLWGVWGAFAEFPTRHGFPETLMYVVWALTMIPPALYAMQRVGWRVLRDRAVRVVGAR